MYRIVSRHPDYDAAREPDIDPATPWWTVARHLIETFGRLLPEGFGARLLHDGERLTLQAHYSVSPQFDVYLVDVSFLPLLKRKHRVLHDLTVDFLALLLQRSRIGDWSEYLNQGLFHDWLSDQIAEEPDEVLQKLLDYYGAAAGTPVRYLKLLHGDTPTTGELAARAGRLCSSVYPEPLRELVTTIRANIPLLDQPDLDIAAYALPYNEDTEYPVLPDIYLSLSWNHHLQLDTDALQQCHYDHIQCQGDEYGLLPLGKVIDCRADEPYEIGRKNKTTEQLFSLLSRLGQLSYDLKRHFGAKSPAQ